jgi:cytochrome c biogenesis protein CcmG/thiol:disulfide interchange protein DsbE
VAVAVDLITTRKFIRRWLTPAHIIGTVLPALILLGFVYLAFVPKTATKTVAATVTGKLSIGATAPDFRTEGLNGDVVQLSHFRGRPVLINFWATWCTACRTEMPAIEQAWERYRSRGFEVIAVDYQESDRTAMGAFLSSLGVRFIAALDTQGKIAAAYNVTVGLPTSIFVGRDGIARTLHLGQMTPSFIDQQIESLL